MWWLGREYFQARDCTIPLTNLNREQLETIEELISELAAPTYDFTVDGKRVVMSKKDMKKELGKSPDIADAFLMTFFGSPYPRPVERHRRPRHWDEYNRGGGSAWGA